MTLQDVLNKRVRTSDDKSIGHVFEFQETEIEVNKEHRCHGLGELAKFSNKRSHAQSNG